MMASKYEKIKHLSHSQFTRCTGVTKFIFDLMVLLVEQEARENKKKCGRPNKLIIEDQVLLLLEYYREYRTFFHLGLDYGLNESNVQRNIEKNEHLLFKSGYFRLKGKRVLADNALIKNILSDVTECPAQKPKKK
jgi:hypothetical protein